MNWELDEGCLYVWQQPRRQGRLKVDGRWLPVGNVAASEGLVAEANAGNQIAHAVVSTLAILHLEKS